MNGNNRKYLTQCLLFVVTKSSSVGVSAYALLPSISQVHHLFGSSVEVLRKVVSPALLSALKQDLVELVEILFVPEAGTGPWQIIVEKNIGLVRSLFGQCTVRRAAFTFYECLSAVRDDNACILKSILSVKADLKFKDPDKGSLIHFAVRDKLKDVLEWLFDYKVSIDTEDRNGSTPLHLAVVQGNVEIVELLLQNGANINARQRNGDSCLYLAVLNRHIRICELLIAKGAEILESEALLHTAASLGHDDVLKFLIQNGMAIDSSYPTGKLKGCTPLFQAAARGDSKIVKYLVQLGANVNAVSHSGQSVLSVALSQKHLYIVEFLLTCHPDVGCQSSRKEFGKLMLSQTENAKKIVQLLLACGFTVGEEAAKNRKILERSIRTNNLLVVQQLLDLGADVNEIYYKSDPYYYNKKGEKCYNKTTHLLEAIRSADVGIIQLLINRGANINFQQSRKGFYHHKTHSESPLSLAVERNNVHAAKALLEQGAESNEVITTNSTKSSPLVLAARHTDGNMIQLLIDHGANVKFSLTKSKRTALSVAVERSNLRGVEILIANKAAVTSDVIEICAAEGSADIMSVLLANSPKLDDLSLNVTFHKAAINNKVEIAKMLLKFDPNVNYILNGFTALQQASKLGLKNMVQLLIIHHADIEGVGEKAKSPLKVAIENNCHDIVRILLKYGASVKTARMVEEEQIVRDFFFCNPRLLMKYISPLNQAINCTSLVKIYERHTIKSIAAGLDFHLAGLPPILENSDNFRFDCETEIARMKGLTIAETEVTLYDILVKDVDKLVCYTRNDAVRKTLELTDLTGQYPIYEGVLKEQIDKALFRHGLLKEGLKIFSRLIRDFTSIPFELREKVIDYLTNQDLAALKYAVTGSM